MIQEDGHPLPDSPIKGEAILISHWCNIAVEALILSDGLRYARYKVETQCVVACRSSAAIHR